MDRPEKFPSETDMILDDVARFRALSTIALIREEWTPFDDSETDRTARLEAAIARRAERREYDSDPADNHCFVHQRHFSFRNPSRNEPNSRIEDRLGHARPP